MTEVPPIEAQTTHLCELARLTDELAEGAKHEHGDRLAAAAARSLARLLDSGRFATCCVPHYIKLAPDRFEREIQIPIAHADGGAIDTRVLVWPVGATDREHPHRHGWAIVAPVLGALTVSETRDGVRRPERAATRQRIVPEDGVTHHIHNRGATIGLSVHIFGR